MNEKTYILMDSQYVTNYWDVTLEEAKQFIVNTWQEWEEVTDEQLHSVEAFDLEKVTEALNGFDYNLFEDEAERLEWLEEVGL